MLLAKLIKLLCPLVFIHAKIKTSNDWGILEKLAPLMLPVPVPGEYAEIPRIVEKGWEGFYVVDKIG